MSPEYLPSEKGALLPVAATPPASNPDQRTHKLESTLFYLCAGTLLLLGGSLYYKDSVPPWIPFASILPLLNAGMLSSLWASLPAPALLFVGAPYFAERSRVTLVRYWIYLLYMVGVAVGAVVFGSEASGMQCVL
jgi:hypothetical protein